MSTGDICYNGIAAALLAPCEPQAPLFTLLRRCVAKRLPYRIYMPSKFVRAVNDRDRGRGMHNFYSRTLNHYLIQQGRGEKVSERMIEQYHDNVRKVLGRPNARRYLGCGGLLWRIAREYSSSLYTDALLGPSTSAAAQK
jgi:hypothetical protein